MNAKRFLSFVLATVMLLSTSVVSFAAETNNTVLTYTNEASYEIVIPDATYIDITTGKGEIDVAVTNAKLEDWTVIAITASSSNYTDGTWNLVNAKNSNDKISYTIGTIEGASDIASGDRVVTANEVTDDTLYVTVSDTSKVGTFTDMITFASEITVDEIEFTIFVENHSEVNGTFYAANGMTWRDWCNSSYNTIGIVLRDDSWMQYPGGYGLLADDYISNESADSIIENGKDYTFGAPQRPLT